MRHLLLAALVLAACSSDPPPQCGSGGTSCADAGSPLDRPVVVDIGPLDAGSDAVDAFVSTDPAPMVDVGSDAGTPDVPVARLDGCGLDPDGACITPGDVPPDQGVPDTGPTDAPVDRPDVRIACSAGGAPDLPCSSNADCAVCSAGPSGAWCCNASGYCALSATACGAEACSAVRPCASGETCCGSVCRNLQTSTVACGECTRSCVGGATCQAGTCR